MFSLFSIGVIFKLRVFFFQKGLLCLVGFPFQLPAWVNGVKTAKN